MWEKIKEYTVIGAFIAIIIGSFWSAWSAGGNNNISSEPQIDCTQKTVWHDQKSEDTNKLPTGEQVVVVNGVDGEDEVCSDKDGTEVSRSHTTKVVDELTLDGVAQLPDGYDGSFSEQDVIDDYATNGQLTRNHFGEYEPPSYDEPVYSERTGAQCSDGSYSSATGRGACSWHGGVATWLYN